MTRRTVLCLVGALTLGASAPGCGRADLPPPDPTGKDLVEGALVAAVTSAETTPGIRTYKVLHVDDFPQPVGYVLHLTAYDPKAPTYEEAQRIQRAGGLKVLMDHFELPLANFIVRDHRVLAVVPLTPSEKATYERARDSRGQKFP